MLLRAIGSGASGAFGMIVIGWTPVTFGPSSRGSAFFAPARSGVSPRRVMRCDVTSSGKIGATEGLRDGTGGGVRAAVARATGCDAGCELGLNAGLNFTGTDANFAATGEGIDRATGAGAERGMVETGLMSESEIGVASLTGIGDMSRSSSRSSYGGFDAIADPKADRRARSTQPESTFFSRWDRPPRHRAESHRRARTAARIPWVKQAPRPLGTGRRDPRPRRDRAEQCACRSVA
jgi:hypothetical protein